MSMLEVVTDINTQNANVHYGSKKYSQAWSTFALIAGLWCSVKGKFNFLHFSSKKLKFQIWIISASVFSQLRH
jgi:hypothetical protein